MLDGNRLILGIVGDVMGDVTIQVPHRVHDGRSLPFMRRRLGEGVKPT